MASEEQLAQCQAIFDQAGVRRTHIEQKAQWAFTVIAFLVPSLASILVFLLRDPAFQTGHHRMAITLLSLSACLLLLSFISAARALAIRGSEMLHLAAVIDDAGYFRKYDRAFHAQGLLYCSTINTATNDHIAQFVKGAHVLTFAAVIAFGAGAIATSLQLHSTPAPLTRMELVGSVSLSETDMSDLHNAIREIAELANLHDVKATADVQIQLLNERIAMLEGELAALQKSIAPPTSVGPPQPKTLKHSRKSDESKNP